MALSDVLSLLGVMAMAAAVWAGGMVRKDGAVFVLQIVGYLLLAVSSWVVGVRAATLALAMCAVTLALKALGRFPVPVAILCLLVTLTGGLIVNDSGWLGLLPVLAGAGVVYQHAMRYQSRSLMAVVGIGNAKERNRWRVMMLPKVDNALRLPTHAIELLLHNIVGVVLWGAYAWRVGDRFMLAWRCLMLAVNLVNFARRIWPPLSRTLGRLVPVPGESKRRKLPGQGRREDWII